MNRKRLGKALLFPSPPVVGLVLPLSLCMMLWGLHRWGDRAPVTIAAYAFSFYGLVILCLRVPAILRRVQGFCRENGAYRRYRSDERLRINLSLYAGVGFNGAYALFQLGLGFWHRSAWFFSMAGYYLLLALMRLSLVRHTRCHAAGEDTALEWRKYRFCGWLLLAMNLTLMVFTLYFVYRIREFRHHPITAIAMAAYTFTAMTAAVCGVVRRRRSGSPAYTAAKTISLAAAAVSMLTLTNALLTTFGQEGEALRRIMLTVTGIVVILLVVGMALYMIVNGNRKLRGAGGEASLPPDQAKKEA